jgi:hypothetical protein
VKKNKYCASKINPKSFKQHNCVGNVYSKCQIKIEKKGLKINKGINWNTNSY